MLRILGRGGDLSYVFGKNTWKTGVAPGKEK